MEGDHFQAGFSRPRTLHLKTSSAEATCQLLRDLGYQVRREPNNLRAHVQHIYALCDAGVSEQRLFSGVAALFAVLGTRGAALQNRLLDRVAPQLSPEGLAALRALPQEPTLPGERPSRPVSELTLVTTVTHEAAEAQDPVSYADELLCAGDYEEATAVLERALTKTPDSRAVAEALQVIYRSSRDAEAYEKSRTIALDGCPDAAAWWPAVNTFLGGR